MSSKPAFPTHPDLKPFKNTSLKLHPSLQKYVNVAVQFYSKRHLRHKASLFHINHRSTYTLYAPGTININHYRTLDTDSIKRIKILNNNLVLCNSKEHVLYNKIWETL